MEKFISTESKNALLKLGLYQIICAVLSLGFFAWLLFQAPTLSGPSIILSIIAVCIMGYSIFAGAQCIKITDSSLTHSLINQGIQILGFDIAGYSFRYFSGPYLTIKLDMTNSFMFDFRIGLSDINIALFGQSNNIQIEINIAALIAFVIVDRINNKVKIEQEIRKDTRFL